MPRIAIVGSGPAGLAFAAAMADTRLDITLLERSATTRALGSGLVLQPTGLAAAEVLNIRAELELSGYPIERVLGHTTRDRVVIDVDYGTLGAGQYALALHRSTLIDVLRSRLEDSGMPIVTGTHIIQFEQTEDGVAWLQDANGNRLGPFDLVVDASGARSVLRTQIFGDAASRTLKYGSLWGTFNLPEGVLAEHTLQQRFGPDNASIGLMPLGRATLVGPQQVAFFWNIECAAYGDWLARGLTRWKDEVRKIWPACAGVIEQIEDPSQLTLAQWCHHSTSVPLNPGIVFVGDAAHATSPQLGQGVNMSLLDAITLARAIRAQPNLVVACQHYAAQRRRQVGVNQTLASALIPFYQSPNRFAIALRNLLFQPLSRLPYVRRLIARLVGGLLAEPMRPVAAGDAAYSKNSSKLTYH